MSGKSLGAHCSCGGRTVVIDSRTNIVGVIRRRRKCLQCGDRFTTYEQRKIAKRASCFVVVHTIEEDGRVQTETFEVTPESGLTVAMEEGKMVATRVETPLRRAS